MMRERKTSDFIDLLERASVPKMKEIVDPIDVDTNKAI